MEYKSAVRSQDTEVRIEFSKKPQWLKVKLPAGENFIKVKNLVSSHKLNTVCEDAMCPNIAECWGKGTCTFMILGDICTRHCSFCSVKSGRPQSIDEYEPMRVALTIKKMDVKYAVITCVNRDDLEDGGAYIFAKLINTNREINPQTRLEVLTSDFQGKFNSIKTVVESRPDVYAHNVETVPSLQDSVRSNSSWDVSINVLKIVKQIASQMKTKTGLQVGHGETTDELIESFKLIKDAGIDILTIGQYLQPTKKNRKVVRYYHPDEFKELEVRAREIGIPYVFSGPLVRSSYKAETVFKQSIVTDPSSCNDR
ncbi:MAG: lipoyl synthase [Planctomycetes bacterium]|nr:lipoyl synthase [Planctomycetota bacterium]